MYLDYIHFLGHILYLRIHFVKCKMHANVCLIKMLVRFLLLILSVALDASFP